MKPYNAHFKHFLYNVGMDRFFLGEQASSANFRQQFKILEIRNEFGLCGEMKIPISESTLSKRNVAYRVGRES